ncbi:FAD-binding oxidoreductase [Amycolatopsis sp. 195334CR]|uniref:FAD-binding oxidoreductase n=1 Tax=Amycolatopsis sp. 195334CR TaxID=2814588 RepID=UPI001A8CB4C9|nr:FAD-binding oxidoreductase [Amycolatopsis sp. 195334CR]MBN6037633.1 FAD-binding oxidoreductase [Amycolatopsis sp. 195334CR]
MIENNHEVPGYQLLAAHRPAVVVDASTSEDIRDAVRLAVAKGEPVAVQATGHGLTRPLDGAGVLITTGGMAAVEVNAAAGTAWVEAGARWRDVIDAAAPYGLAPLSGSLPGVGAVSYTLGGGVGVLARRYGFAADHVRRIDLVTADGELREVTAESDPDLFWALRGGGGNFGVVTGMEIELVPVARLHGGTLTFDVRPELLETWYRWTAGLPEEMTSAVAVLAFPGHHVAKVQIAHLGSGKDGDELLEPLRALGPLADEVREIPFARSEVVFGEPDQPHAYRGDNLLLADVEPAKLPALADRTAAMCVVGLRHLGGALSRPAGIPNAVGHRDAGYLLGVLSPTSPEEVPAVRARHDALLEPWSAQAVGRSLNFLFDDVDPGKVESAFAPADYRKLAALKAELDPDALFRANFPIPPG